MDVKVLLITTLLFVNCFVVSMGNETTTLTTDVHGITESHTTTVVTDTNYVPTTTSADKPIVTEVYNIQSRSTTESPSVTEANVQTTASEEKPIVTYAETQTINNTDKSNRENEATVSDSNNAIADNKTVLQTESATQVSTTTDDHQNTNKSDTIDTVHSDTSATSSNDVIRQQQKPNEVTESVTTIYKIEMKTKSVAEVEPNMDRFIDPPSPTNTDTAAAVKVEEKGIKEAHSTDANTTNIPDSTTTSIADETTTFSQQEDIPLLLKELIKQHLSEKNTANANIKEITSGDDLMDHNATSDEKQGSQIIEWWENINPNTEIKIATVTVKNADIDTRIITTDKLVIVISTICGSFVMFVVILIVVSCCRRNNNARTDSEKSGTSEFSVVSTRSNVHYEKQSAAKSRSDTKTDYNDVFMGIPTNNAIWKDLDNLPDTASSVMPESTKL